MINDCLIDRSAELTFWFWFIPLPSIKCFLLKNAFPSDLDFAALDFNLGLSQRRWLISFESGRRRKTNHCYAATAHALVLVLVRLLLLLLRQEFLLLPSYFQYYEWMRAENLLNPLLMLSYYHSERIIGRAGETQYNVNYGNLLYQHLSARSFTVRYYSWQIYYWQKEMPVWRNSMHKCTKYKSTQHFSLIILENKLFFKI